MSTGFSQTTGIDTGSLEDMLGGGEIRSRVIPGLAAVVATPASADVPAYGAGTIGNANGDGNGNGHRNTAIPVIDTAARIAALTGEAPPVTHAAIAAAIAGTVPAATTGAPSAAAAGAAPAVMILDGTPDHASLAMHTKRSLRTAAPLLAADAMALAAAGLMTQLLLRLLGLDVSDVLGAAAPLALVPLVIGYWICGLYSEVWVHPALELRQATHVTTVALLAAALAGWWSPPLAAWCAAAWVLVVPLVPLARAAARHCCAGLPWWGFPTLVIGSGAGADRLARLLTRSRTCGLRPVLLTDPDSACRASVVPVMNDPAVLRSMVRSKGIRHAVLCLSDLPAAKVNEAFDRYGALASHLLVVSDTPPLPTLWGAQRVCGLGGVEVRNGLLLAPLRVVKRAMDVAVASAVLVLGFPLFAAIALMVKLSGPGGVLYGHQRIGRYGRKFTAWKFRTMHRGADALLRQHFDRFPAARLEWERDQKLRDDPRVTKVGHFLRRLSLDELPQMWNVLRGEMSVVGPRPIVDDEVARYGDAFGLYAGVKPGITGLWQVSGRTDVGYEMRVRLDEFYVRHWSPWLDAYLLVRTVVALLCRRGAY
jgi:Undecaprenyl-phosphate galactose phosphotransferase WbaP